MMKWYLLILGYFGLMINLLATKDTVAELAKVYQLNNELIHKKLPFETRKTVELLTDNYIEQLKHFKQLSDRRLRQRLNQQHLDFIVDDIFLKKHILNLYSYQSKPLVFDEHRIQRLNTSIETESGLCRQPAEALIRRIIRIFNEMSKDPELVRGLYGVLPRDIASEWYIKASDNKKKNIFLQFKLKNIKTKNGDSTETLQVFYIFGDLEDVPVLWRLLIERGDFGVFVKEFSQTRELKYIHKIDAKFF